MCKGVDGLPRGLRDLGYVDQWIEFAFANSANQAVVPELIIASNQLRHTILFEWKEGANTDAEQLRRYAQVTTDDLRQKVFLVEEAESHDIALVATGEHRERIVIAIDRERHNFPVLVTHERGLEKIRNRFVPEETDALFRPLFEFNWNEIPTFLYPLDIDSTLAEYAELIAPTILERMGAGETRILLDQIASVIIPVWENVDAAYQNRLARKILEVMERAVRHEFAPFIRRNRAAAGRTHTPTWDIVENPVSNLADRTSLAWKQMIPRVRSLIDFFEHPEHQPDLPLEEGA